VRGKHRISDVDLARPEPISLSVIGNPADDAAVDDNARGRAGRRLGSLFGLGKPPPSLRIVSAFDKDRNIIRTWRSDGDVSVRLGPAIR